MKLSKNIGGVIVEVDTDIQVHFWPKYMWMYPETASKITQLHADVVNHVSREERG